MLVARHCPSQTLVVIKQTNVDVQNAEQFENLKVCACFEVYQYLRLPLLTDQLILCNCFTSLLYPSFTARKSSKPYNLYMCVGQ